MFFSTLAARFMNARLTAPQRARLQNHAGAVTAMQAGTLRMCFRLDGSGRWLAVSPLLAADATARWQPTTDGEYFQISGNAALLRDLGDWWKDNTPRQLLADCVGNTAAAALSNAAAKLELKKCLQQSGLAAAPRQVTEFNRQVAQLAQRSRNLKQRLENLHERNPTANY